MNILSSTKLVTTPKGHSELVALAVEQAELNTEEEPVIIEDEHVERYILCANQALPYFSVSQMNNNKISLWHGTNIFLKCRLKSNQRRL